MQCESSLFRTDPLRLNEVFFPIAWVSSVHLAAGRLFGILAAILIDRFGCRTVAVIGSALAALGCLASSFASSLILFICLYSLISGVGYALLFTSSVVIVQQHWRPLGYLPIANGFALAGMGVGAIAFGPISRAFIGNYDWRSYLLFLAAAFAVVLGLSLLYKAPTTEADTKKKKRKIFNVALLKSPSVVLFMVAVILMFLGLSAPFVHMVTNPYIHFYVIYYISHHIGSLCPRPVFVSSRSRLSCHLFRYWFPRRSCGRRIYRKSSSSPTGLSLSYLPRLRKRVGLLRAVDSDVRRSGRLRFRVRFLSGRYTLLCLRHSGKHCDEGAGATGGGMVHVLPGSVKRNICSYCRWG